MGTQSEKAFPAFFTPPFRKAGLVLLALCAACALLAQPWSEARRFGRFGGGFGFSGGLLRGAVTGAPFSATQTTTTQRFLTDGTQIQNQSQSKVYRDAVGRVRIDKVRDPAPVNRGGGTGRRSATIIYDPVAGYIYRLNLQEMTALQSPIRQHPEKKATRMPPAGVEVQSQNLDSSLVNGVNATGAQVTRTIAPGTIGNPGPIQIVRATWVSTQLQVPVQISISNPLFGNTSMNLTNIVQAAPAESLFQVPAGYKVIQAPARALNAAPPWGKLF